MNAARIILAQYKASPKYTDDITAERRLRRFVSDNINALYDMKDKNNEWIKKIKMYPVSTQLSEEKYCRMYIYILRCDKSGTLDAGIIDEIAQAMLNRLDEGELHDLWMRGSVPQN